ncbi:fibronectin type III domain-containing protein [Phytohabitans kaempferiae]|uniref:Fibronectin type III domain-containing protein n=1 Tax=Phytohabitans kaempferiae TaxID=1620943 RepID=A0ABV6M2K8_9ACTN
MNRVRSGVTALIIFAITVTLLPMSDASRSGEIRNADARTAIPGQFLAMLAKQAAGSDVEATVRQLVAKYGGSVMNVYEALPGFAFSATDAQASRLARDPAVEYVERNLRGFRRDTQDTRAFPSGPDPNQPYDLWHLDRIDQRAQPPDGRFNHGTTNVPIYIVDDGILLNHVDFGGPLSRVSVGFNAFAPAPYRDCDGHATHVAGLAAGSRYGVAKQSPIISIKVLDCNSGTVSGLVAGLNHILVNGQKPAVVNMSLGFPGIVSIVDQTTKMLLDNGFTVVIAAGNDPNEDTCTTSPTNVAAGSEGGISVAATDQFDQSFSDNSYGDCVTLFAPGVDVPSASHLNPALSAPPDTGTSFAAPQVSGAAATLLATHPSFSPSQVRAALVADATPGVVQNSQSPAAASRLLYVPLPDQPGTSVSSSDLNELFNAYGDQGGHWTGGDETVSVELPDGRVAWFFGDTMLGTVNPDGTRPRGTPMVHNSVVIQDGDTLTETLIGGTPTNPHQFVGTPSTDPDDLGWWPGEARVVGGELHVFYTHVGHGGGGALSFTTLDQAVARFSLPDLTLVSLTPLGLGKQIDWGAAAVPGGDGYIYVYGTANDGATRNMYVARAPENTVTNAASLRFWNGQSWSALESQAARVMTDVGAGFSVKEHNGRYVLVTFDESQPFTARILGFSAETPTGPFLHPRLLYQAPEASGNTYVYNARIHPEQSSSGDFVVSYNVNSFDPDDVYANARRYRPKFVDVTLPPPVDASLLPDAPRALTGSANSTGAVNLSWTMPGGAKNSNVVYRVYQRNADAGATQFTRPSGTVSATSTTVGIFNPGVYEFRVTAQNTSGEGPPSLPVSVVVVIPPPAQAPANLTGTANPDGSVSLSWGAVSGAGWINYRVYQRNLTANEADFAEARSAVVNGTTARITGLTRGGVYEFRVHAFNGGGEGPPSNVVQLTSRIDPPPRPTNLVASSNEDGTIGLTWTSSGPGIWYWVYSRDVTADPDAQFTRHEYPVSTGPANTAGYLTVGHTYEFYVVAFNEGGESLASNTVSAVSRIAPPPAPTNLVATSREDGTIGLSWTSSGAGIWYYVYYRDIDNGEATFTKSIYPVVDRTTFTAGYLTAGHRYEFYVTSINEGGESASNHVEARSTVAPPPAPTNLTVSPSDDGTIELSWGSSGPDIWYWVYYRNVSDGEAFTRIQYPVSTGTTFTAGYLTVGDTYAFYVTAIAASGDESAPSNTAQAVSYMPPPAAPRNLRATAGNGQVILNWTAPAAGLWYYVYTRDVTAGGQFVRSQYPITSGTTHTATVLTNGHTYAFYVTTIGTGGGESPPSNTVQAVPRLPVPPAPTNLTATARADGTIRLTWGSSGAGIWYWVYTRDVTSAGSFTRSKYPVSNGTAFTVDHLTLNHRYAFYVTAFNDGGESPRSNTVEATATVPPPPAPSNVTATARNDGTIRLTWNSSGSGLWYYVYTRDVTAGGSFQRSRYPITNGTAYSAGYLVVGHVYAFYVRAINEGGEGPASSTVQATATILAPSNVRAGWTDHATARVSWSSGNPGGWFYLYVRDVDAGGAFVRQTYPVSGRTWQVVRPLGGSAYQFYVTEIGPYGGESPRSPTVTLASNYPLPAAGSVSAQVPYSLRCYVTYIEFCEATVYPTATLSGWSPNFQYLNQLNIGWEIRHNGNLRRSSSDYCRGASDGITSCQRTGPTFTVAWARALGPPTICVRTTGFGHYYRNSDDYTRIERSRNDCVVPGSPEGLASGR